MKHGGIGFQVPASVRFDHLARVGDPKIVSVRFARLSQEATVRRSLDTQSPDIHDCSALELNSRTVAKQTP